MKKLALALFLVAASAQAQFTNFAHHATATAGHANGLPAASFVGPYSGTPVLGDMIVFDGTNWVSVAAGTNGQVLTENTNLLPTWQASASGGLADPGGNGLVNRTALNTTAPYAGTSCTNQIPTALSAAGVATCTTATGSFFGTGIAAASIFGNFTASTAAPTFTAATVAGTRASYDGSTIAFRKYPVDPTTESVLFEDFMCRAEAAGNLRGCGDYALQVTGTAAGVNPTPATTVDANTVGMIELTTGSTTTGGSGLSTNTTDSVLISGSEVLQIRANTPTASAGTNTYVTADGFCDVAGSSAVCTNGLWISWDNNTDTHWIIHACKASTCTNSTSNTVATTGYHTKLITVDANLNTHFFIDGVELNVSPLGGGIGTNIPNTVSVALMSKIKASAGCAAATTCIYDVDYHYFRKPVTR